MIAMISYESEAMMMMKDSTGTYTHHSSSSHYTGFCRNKSRTSKHLPSLMGNIERGATPLLLPLETLTFEHTENWNLPKKVLHSELCILDHVPSQFFSWQVSWEITEPFLSYNLYVELSVETWTLKKYWCCMLHKTEFIFYQLYVCHSRLYLLFITVNFESKSNLSRADGWIIFLLQMYVGTTNTFLTIVGVAVLLYKKWSILITIYNTQTVLQ